MPAHARIRAAGLAAIDEKLRSNERLTLDDGVALFRSPDLLAIGAVNGDTLVEHEVRDRRAFVHPAQIRRR